MVVISYHIGAIAVTSEVFSEGTLSTVLIDVNCTGSESSLTYCSTGHIADYDCGQYEDAGVVCQGAHTHSCHEMKSQLSRVAKPLSCVVKLTIIILT